ncbi:MAG: 50S ribosomal protein L15 [bacterium]
MKLNELKPTEGSRTKAKRLGRGRSSGMGKTSTKGQKGQGAHNKHKKAGFEGGQTPMTLRFPKRGFKNFSRGHFAVVNVGLLGALDFSGEITVQVLKERKVIADVLDGLRVLGDGEIKKALTIKALHFSASAKAKIEAAGGKAVTEA